MAGYVKASNWRTELENYCPCFSHFPILPPECDGLCNANRLRELLLQRTPPKIYEVVMAMMECRTFGRKQIISMLVELYKIKPNAANRNVDLALKRLNDDGKKAIIDSHGKYIIV